MHTFCMHVSRANLWFFPGVFTRVLLTALHRLMNGMGPYGMAGSGHPILSARDACICTFYSGLMLWRGQRPSALLVHFFFFCV